MKKQKSISDYYFYLFIVLLFCVYQYSIKKIYGFSIYPDEFGYWASAAKLVGYDWTKLTSLDPYYSYGYSLVLYPILKFTKDAILAYRIAITINMLLTCFSGWLIWKSLKELFPEPNKMMLTYAAGIGMFYPSLVFFMQMTLTESLLTALYMLTCYLVIKLYQHQKVTTAIALIIILVYMYFVHMRTVGVIIAGVITMIIMVIKFPSFRRKGMIALGLLAILVMIGALLKQEVIRQVFTEADPNVLATNDYAGSIGTIKEIFTFSGMIQFIMGCMGKAFYLMMASFGLVYWAVKYLGKQWIQLVRKTIKKEIFHLNEIISIFLLLSLLGQFFISAIFMFRPGRIDGIVYGRYNEYMIPIFIGIGMIELFRSKKIFKETLIVGLCTGLAVPAINFLIHKGNLTDIQGYFMLGISYLLDDANFDAASYFGNAYLLGFAMMLFVALCVWLCKIREGNYLWLFFIIVLEIGLTILVSHKYTYAFNSTFYSDTKVYKEVQMEIEEDSTITYLHENGRLYIKSIQFLLMEEQIQIIYEDQLKQWEFSENNVLITNQKSKYNEELKKKYPESTNSSSFTFFYYNKDK